MSTEVYSGGVGEHLFEVCNVETSTVGCELRRSAGWPLRVLANRDSWPIPHLTPRCPDKPILNFFCLFWQLFLDSIRTRTFCPALQKNGLFTVSAMDYVGAVIVFRAFFFFFCPVGLISTKKVHHFPWRLGNFPGKVLNKVAPNFFFFSVLWRDNLLWVFFLLKRRWFVSSAGLFVSRTCISQRQ